MEMLEERSALEERSDATQEASGLAIVVVPLDLGRSIEEVPSCCLLIYENKFAYLRLSHIFHMQYSGLFFHPKDLQIRGKWSHSSSSSISKYTRPLCDS